MGMVRLLTAAAKILIALEEGPKTFTEIKRETGLSEGAVALNLRNLEIQGLVSKNGRTYELTEKGEVALEELRIVVLSRR